MFRTFNPWWHVCLQLCGIAVLVLLPLRLFFGREALWPGATLCLLLLLLRHVRHIRQLLCWLEGPIDAPLPQGHGAWDWIFAGLHRRVRERQAQAQRLSLALERFRRAIQALPDGIIIFNQHTQIEWINEQAEKQFDLCSATDLGLPLTSLIRQPEFVHYLQQGTYATALTFRNPRHAGQTLLLQIVPYAEHENLLLSRDVSDQERLDMMRRDFVANVSHELKTPLTVVSGFAEMLAGQYDAGDTENGEAGEPDPALTRRYLGLISEQSQRMQRMIEDLLTLSSLEASLRVDDSVCEVLPMLESVLAETQALSDGRHPVRLEVSGTTRLRACPTELRSVLGNLASNAVRYTPAGGAICLRWQADASGAHYAVEDAGIGIAAVHLPRLTERFYRVDRGRSRETGGTGLGLAIVKHILNRHQGRLEIVSEPGRGSCFTASFPASRVIG